MIQSQTILAIDTATEACSAALLLEGEIIERYELAPRRHGELILGLAEAVLVEGGVTIAQLDAVAFGRGPGSFTGLRIAAGVAQGIAYGAEVPIIPVSTLAAIARGAMIDGQQSHFAVAVDARMDEIYWATYVADGMTVALLGEERVCPPHAAALPLLPGEESNSGGALQPVWYGVGSGWGRYTEMLLERVPVQEWDAERYPRAGDIALLAALGDYQAMDAQQALPVYLRDQVIQSVSKPC